MNRPTIAPELRDLILRGLAEPYISESCLDAVQTGNHYQSIRLGDVETTGFRSDREEILDRIDFTNKSVLDLGSNLGELSRSARRRGARLVDGFEYDPFFVEVANAVNAFSGTSRVSFFETDITDPAVYREPYDVVLAFSVTHYVYRVLPDVARVARALLVVETHRLEDNLESHYIAPVLPYLPAYRVLGISEWSTGGTSADQRAVLAFARTETALESGLAAFEPVEATAMRV